MASKEQNSKMARMMKDKGIQRNTGSCPICHRSVLLNSIQDHILSCKG